ncbi:MAG: hypothetical protein J5J00_08080 [Deltaproteobacteria bacterium]|nr:hypothetical protein [Deltaproteobacteria bacterium]
MWNLSAGLEKPAEDEEPVNEDPKILHITEASSVEHLNPLIHDEYFELCQIGFDADRQIVTIPFRRIFHGVRERIVRRGLFSTIYEVDVLRARLLIKNASAVKIRDNANLAICSFNTIWYESSLDAIKISCCEDCELEIGVTAIDLFYEALDYGGTAEIRRWLFGIETSGSRVRE